MKAYIRRDLLADAEEVVKLVDRLHAVNSSLASIDRGIERITTSIGRNDLLHNIAHLEKQFEGATVPSVRAGFPGMSETEAGEWVEKARASIMAELSRWQGRLTEWERENLPALEKLETSKKERLDEREQLQEQLSRYAAIDIEAL